MSEQSGAAAQHLPPDRERDQTVSRRSHSVRVRRGGRNSHLRGQQLAPSCRGSSTRPVTVGTIAGTGMADWPISYEELEPYYTQAEWEMGMSGSARRFTVCRADVQGLSSAAGAPEGLGRPVQRGGRQARADRGARPTRDHHQGRIWVATGCVHCGMCSGFGCHVEARDPARRSRCIPIAVETGNCEIRVEELCPLEIST